MSDELRECRECGEIPEIEMAPDSDGFGGFHIEHVCEVGNTYPDIIISDSNQRCVQDRWNQMQDTRTTTREARLEEALEHIQAIVNKGSSVYKLAKQALEDK